MDGWLSELFLGELELSRRAELEHVPDLDATLASMLTAGQSAHPAVALEPADYVRHLATIIGQHDGPSEPALRALLAADLYLACGCAHGDPAAVAAFERDYMSTLEPALRSTGLDSHGADDVRQRVREQLLVGTNDVPGIASYAGRGQLRSWLRAVAVRQAMMHFRARREIPADDSALEEIALTHGDAQLAPWKQQYAEAFRAAFAEAVKSLSEPDRMLLRQHHLDQLSVDELATLHNVHRATAARRVAAARNALLENIRERMTKQLAISGTELDSALRLARSQLDVSMHRLLGGKRARK